MSQENNAQKAKAPLNGAQAPATRRHRRRMLKSNGMLRYLSKINFFNPNKIEIRAVNMDNGRKFHQAHLDAIEKMQAEQLESLLERMKENWSRMGYNKTEIAMLEEAWAITTIKDKETYQQDKRKANELMKEAAAMRAERNSG